MLYLACEVTAQLDLLRRFADLFPSDELQLDIPSGGWARIEMSDRVGDFTAMMVPTLIDLGRPR